MFDIDKKNFGCFIAELRKQKGLTQKELAEKLFVSDKAVSKWECGLSLPDISLLVPLGKILGVTVAELLECRRLDHAEHIDPEKVDEIVGKALHFSDEEIQEAKLRKRRTAISFLASILICVVEIAIALALGTSLGEIVLLNIFLPVGLALIFGACFCFFAKEKLPTYYDENKISIYHNGFFELHMPGIQFNNNNWPHILKTGRIWSMSVLVIFPLIYIGCVLLFTDIVTVTVISTAALIAFLIGLFVPLYFVARKYA